MASVRCPICNRLFEPDQSPALPFCSDRCRWIDLKHWLDEEYDLDQEPDEESEDAAAEE